MDIGALVPELLLKHPGVANVILTGSRSRGEATRWSDWDFLINTTDFEAVSSALPVLTEKLKPLSHLWDPLSQHQVYMLILKGPEKVDIIFDRPHRPEPPWTIKPDTLACVNSHFWDWILWTGSKKVRGQTDTFTKDMGKIYTHLLKPLGCIKIPGSIEEAVREYKAAFRRKKSRFHTEIDPTLEVEVVNGLKVMGFQI